MPIYCFIILVFFTLVAYMGLGLYLLPHPWLNKGVPLQPYAMDQEGAGCVLFLWPLIIVGLLLFQFWRLIQRMNNYNKLRR